ncbi:MAG: ZIP family metal transporter [Planctomycetia bacterium]
MHDHDTFTHARRDVRMPSFAFAAAESGPLPFLTLALQLAVVSAAAYAGGSSLSFLSMGHRRMQVLLSLTGGVLLGVGLLHLLPHAFLQLDRQIDTTMLWVLAGFFLMFLLERAFHGHSHHTADGDPAHDCGHDHAGHAHAHGDHGAHVHTHATTSAGASGSANARLAWCGAFAGLALHSVADGAALAASVQADGNHGAGWLAGFATFLAVLLHKPFDAAIIGTLMINSGVSGRGRRIANALYALIVPLGAVAFLASLRLFGDHQATIIGVAMALAAGAFLCIAAADLLPEVQFHSHDRVLLTLSLALGLGIAWGITLMERSSHAHAHGHTHQKASSHDGH